MKAPLSITHPEIAAEWHPTKNEGDTPDEVLIGSRLNVWWKCSKGPDHEWQDTLSNRTKRARGCPFCRGLRISVTNSLALRFPKVAAEWHPTKNGNLTPDKVVAGSGKKAWWRCSVDSSHEWQAVIGSRVDGRGCPICAGRITTPANSLQALQPQLAAEWHPDKNGGLTTGDVTPGSHKKVWWRCSVDASHEWEAVVSNRKNGTGCPMCDGRVATPTTSLRASTRNLLTSGTHIGTTASRRMLSRLAVTRKSGGGALSTLRTNGRLLVLSRKNGNGCPMWRRQGGYCDDFSANTPSQALQRNGTQTRTMASRRMLSRLEVTRKSGGNALSTPLTNGRKR